MNKYQVSILMAARVLRKDISISPPRYTLAHTHRHTHRKQKRRQNSGRHADRQADRQKDGETDRRTNRQTDRVMKTATLHLSLNRDRINLNYLFHPPRQLIEIQVTQISGTVEVGISGTAHSAFRGTNRVVTEC